MKIFKCPFCGKDPETHYYNEEEGHDEFWITGCPDCDLFSGITAASKEISQRDWNTLIAKFPPIMRVQVGDKIRHIHQFSPYRGTPEVIERVDVESGIIKTSGCSSYLRPSSITTWPWELEQKGGEEQ